MKGAGRLVAAALAAAALAGCGEDAAGPGAASATSTNDCSPLLERAMQTYQDAIDRFAAADLAELQNADFSLSTDDDQAKDRALLEEAKELRCSPADLLLMVADRGDQMIAETPGAEVAKAHALSAIANALFYGPADSETYGAPSFAPAPQAPEEPVSAEEIAALDVTASDECPGLVDARLLMDQAMLDAIALSGTPSEVNDAAQSVVDDATHAAFLRALTGSECSLDAFAREYLTRAGELEALGAFANLERAELVLEQWEQVRGADEGDVAAGTDVEVFIVPSVKIATPGQRVVLAVTVENSGTAPLDRVTLLEDPGLGGTRAVAVGLPELETGTLAPGARKRFSVTFEVPHVRGGSLPIEYDVRAEAGGSTVSTTRAVEIPIRRR